MPLPFCPFELDKTIVKAVLEFHSARKKPTYPVTPFFLSHFHLRGGEKKD